MPALTRFTAIRVNATQIRTPQILAEADAVTLDHCARIITDVSAYPPVPGPPNRYERTGRLLANWRLKRLGEASYQVYNATQDRRGRYYAGYVHGQSSQTWFHRGHGWRNIKDYLRRAEFRVAVQAVITRGIRF